jgi:hypothetical protein
MKQAVSRVSQLLTSKREGTFSLERQMEDPKIREILAREFSLDEEDFQIIKRAITTRFKAIVERKEVPTRSKKSDISLSPIGERSS